MNLKAGGFLAIGVKVMEDNYYPIKVTNGYSLLRFSRSGWEKMVNENNLYIFGEGLFLKGLNYVIKA